MTKRGQRVLCVIPARGGSKSIPRKNLEKIGSLSLVAHASNIARSIPAIDLAIISSDDLEIISEAVASGLTSPFIRPPHLSSDTATSLEVWQHAWTECERQYREEYDISVLLEPTCPLRSRDDVERCMEVVLAGKYPAALTVSRTPAHYAPEKALTILKDGSLNYYIGSGGTHYHNRQLIPQYYHRNGACYVASKEQIFKRRTIIEGAYPVLIERQLVNIDDISDLNLARSIYKKLNESY